VHAALEEFYEKGTRPSVAYTRLALQEQDSLEQEFAGLWAKQLGELKAGGELGLGMMKGYESWAKKDKFRVLSTEMIWEVPVHENLSLAGRFDMLIERDGQLWLMDFKTTKSAGPSSCRWTGQDLQASMYVWAARQIYGPEVQGIIFRFIRKKLPDTWEKLILKSGKLTTRKNLVSSTTLQEYDKALAILAFWADGKNLPYEALARVLEEGGDPPAAQFIQLKKDHWTIRQALKEATNPYFWDIVEHRTQAQLHNYFNHIVLPACAEMNAPSNERWIGPTGLGAAFFLCPSCSFKAPCEVAMAGGNYQDLLREDYKKRELL